MPRLRAMLKPNASLESRARQLCNQGLSIRLIAFALNQPIEWVRGVTGDVEPTWRMIQQSVSVGGNRRLRGEPLLPSDVALRRRIINLAQRGFDVPPSKQEDWKALGKKRKSFSVAERVRLLGLE